MRRLNQEGKSILEIARELGLSRGTVRRYLRGDRCPDWQRRESPRTQLDGFRADIDGWIRDGCRDATVRHRELAERGARASYDSVRRFVTRRLAAAGVARQRANAAQFPAVRPPSARRLSHDVIRKTEDRKPEEQARVTALRGAGAEVGEAVNLVVEVAAMIRKRSAPAAGLVGRRNRLRQPGTAGVRRGCPAGRSGGVGGADREVE